MGKSGKKSASKVAAVDAPVLSPAKPLKKGKREAELVSEKELVPALSPAKALKKGKREAEVVIEKELVSAKKQKASKNKSESKQKPKAKAPGKPDSDSSGVAEDAPTPVPDNGRSGEELVVPAKKEEETEEDLKKKTKAIPEKSSEPNDTGKEQSIGGSKTLFVKNVSYQAQKADVVEFFKPAGGVVDVRLAKSREDDSFKGYGHVVFASAEQAEKALLELNGKELLNRPVTLEVAREEKNGEQKQSFKRRPKLEVFVTGFDAFAGEDNIRASIMAHFASCGKIARVSIHTGPPKASKGIAYVQFLNENARRKALELGNETLVVEEPRPTRADRNTGRGARGFNNSHSKDTPGTGVNTTSVGGD